MQTLVFNIPHIASNKILLQTKIQQKEQTKISNIIIRKQMKIISTKTNNFLLK